MPYNIGSSEIIANEGFRISVTNLKKARRSIDRHPEGSVLRTLFKEVEKREKEAGADLPGETELPIAKLAWYGESSGTTYDGELLQRFLPLTKGRADIIFTWEGGDSFSGVRVIDGVVERRRVVQALGDIEK